MNREELYERFQNYPCWMEGHLAWNGQIYSYKLESSVPLWLWHIDTKTEDKRIGFGCFNKAGEKYIYEIALSNE